MNINGSSESYISIYFRGNNKTALYAKLSKKLGTKWDYVTNIEPTDAICEIVSFKQTNHSNIFVIDTSSKLIVSGQRLERYTSNDWQYAKAGNEIIKFKQMKKLQSGLYEISHLIRGLSATEEAIQEQKEGDIFIFLEKGPNIIRASENLKNQQIAFKANNIEKIIDFQNKSQSKLKPYIVSSTINQNILHINWIDRTNAKDTWTLESISPNKIFKVKLISGNQTHEYTAETNEIKINISQLELSANFEINIIAE